MPLIVPEIMPEIPNLTEVLAGLDMTSRTLEQSMAETETQLAQMENSTQDIGKAQADLDQQMTHESKRYDYFRSLAEYVNDLGEFLDVKVSRCMTRMLFL